MFKLSDYILNLNDLREAALYFLKKITLRNIAEIFVLIILFFIFKYNLEWQTDSSLFMLFWIALFYWNLDSRISIGMGLVSLLSCPILLYLSKNFGLIMGEIWAEQMAVWTYYFLVIGVTKQIWKHKKEIIEEVKKIKTLDEVIQEVELKAEKSRAYAKKAINYAKTKTLDELIEEIQRKENKRAQRNENAAKQKMMMDVIPTKKRRR